MQERCGGAVASRSPDRSSSLWVCATILLVDRRRVLDVSLDWKYGDDRKRFLLSQDLSILLAQWKSGSISYHSSDPWLFALPAYRRENVFQPPTRSSEDCVSVFLSFFFSPSFDLSSLDPYDYRDPPRTKEHVWSNAWSVLYNAALKADGGSYPAPVLRDGPSTPTRH